MSDLTRRSFLQSAALSSLALAVNNPSFAASKFDTRTTGSIEQIDIYHLAHLDIGYTDQPAVAREMQRRYVNLAVDACRRTASGPAGERFHWTTESTIPVLDWWNAAPPDRRAEFLRVVQDRQIDVAALPCNNTPYMSEEEWAAAVSWLPEDLWKAVRPRIAIQDDVNGFPRAGALKLLDRGITHVLTGINGDTDAPFPAPKPFWWKMPDGRRVFVYLAQQYGEAYDLLGQDDWRLWDSPSAGNPFARPPRPGEIFRSDEESVRKAHGLCLERIAKIEATYPFPRLIASVTDQWRWDNDPPFPPLASFIAAWNRLGLKPALRFITATQAVLEFEQTYGAQLPVYQGEWTDWWANGAASIPRELAASRLAKRYLRAARSEAWGPYDAAWQAGANPMWRDLVLFDEHTYDSADSVLLPYSYETLGEEAQKALYAYRAMGEAQLLLGSRMRARLDDEPEGLYVGNPTPSPMTGWVRFPKRSVRSAFRSLKAGTTLTPVYFDKVSDRILATQFPAPPDAQPPKEPAVVRFWVQDLAPHSVRQYQFADSEASELSAPPAQAEVEVDEHGWPKSATWLGMTRPLFLSGFGDFLAVEGHAPRRPDLTNLLGHRADQKAAEQTRKLLEQIPATADGPVEIKQTPFTTIYSQTLHHPRLNYLVRCLELWKGEPRARLSVQLYRISSTDPENLYLSFQLPSGDELPVLSSGGTPFVPFQDQLGDTCRSFFAIDGWADYKTPDGEWLWVTRDAPLVTIGGPYELKLDTREAGVPGMVSALIFTNFWDTNFAADSHGEMEFQFDLVWKKKIDDPAAVAETLMAEPAVLINPEAREDPLVQKDLWRP